MDRDINIKAVKRYRENVLAYIENSKKGVNQNGNRNLLARLDRRKTS